MFENELYYQCLDCGSLEAVLKQRNRCDCGGLLDIIIRSPMQSLERYQQQFLNCDIPSGVWRYKSWHVDIPRANLAWRGEGKTRLYHSNPTLQEYTGMSQFFLKHEGENPTGSFKDRGMSVAIAAAHAFGHRKVACASTGNTSASMAAYAAYFGMQAFVVLPSGKTALGKISQALAYGAKTLEIEGSFDDALRHVQKACELSGTVLLNSINPFRIEGQKTIGFELWEDLKFQVPDWIVLPGGNLGNVSAIGKAFMELKEWGFIDRLPRFAVVQADGANPFAQMMEEGSKTIETQPHPETVATAIRIGSPISWQKALRVLKATNGVSLSLSDARILEAKQQVDRAGIGAEPASCAAVGGLRDLVLQGTIQGHERVVCVLTGHVLKDPEIILSGAEGQRVVVQNNLQSVLKGMQPH